MKNKYGYPKRSKKNLTDSGLNMLIDSGLPLRLFKDVVESHGRFINFIKFGFGSGPTNIKLLKRKIKILNSRGIPFFFGGTLFEYYVKENCLKEYLAFCQNLGTSYIEVSNGSLELLDQSSKTKFIRRLSQDGWKIISEVGYKEIERADEFTPQQWVDAIQSDLESGALWVILETRESGQSGICRRDGSLRHTVIEAVIRSGISPERLIFEAPTTGLQVAIIEMVGMNANFGNIQWYDIAGSEAGRRGVRGGTLNFVLEDNPPEFLRER